MDTTSAMRFVYGTPLSKLVLGSPAKGAGQLVWLAEGAPGVDWESGTYYEKKKRAISSAQARDAQLAVRLWDRSCELVGLAA